MPAGIGPAVAIPKAVQAAGLKLSDIDVFEINEAFASQVQALVFTLLFCASSVGIVNGLLWRGRQCTVSARWAFQRRR